MRSLLEAFETEFRLASSTRPNEWRYLGVEELVAIDGTAVEGELAAACEQVKRTHQRVVAELDDRAGCVVAVPLPKGLGLPPAAVAVVEGIEPDMLRRLAKLWSSAICNEQLVEKYSIECQNLTEQLMEGLEESTFLRSMISSLDMSDHSKDLLAMAETVLPLMNDIVRAECLALLLTPEGIEPLDAIPTLTIGEKPIPDILLSRLIEWFGDAAQEQTIVKNNLHLTPEGTKLRGIRDFILVPMRSRTRQFGWMLAINRQMDDLSITDRRWESNQLEFGTSEASLVSSTVAVLATHASNRELFREKEQMLVNVVRSLVSALDAKDEYTCGHSERVALYAKALAQELGYDDEKCERIYMTGLLHDVGKIGVSDAVLKKPGKLTDEEFAEIKRHPDEGWAILQDLAQLRYVLPGVLYHHEEVDGSGYPDGLRGDNIPLDGRILAIVDAWDAMTSDRPYRKGMPVERAMQIIDEGAGTQWDPQIVEFFYKALDKIELIRQTYRLRGRPVRKAGCSI